MKLKNNYFILRHGQTIYQTKKKGFIYPSPFSSEGRSVKLTRKGENQIKKAAQKLKKEKIGLIFASDFFRTKQTAKIAVRELGARVKFDKRLRDINLGIYRGERKEEFYERFPKFSIKRFSQKPVRGESWSDCQKRMAGFLKEIDKKFQGKTILIISHGDPLWLLEGAVKQRSFKKLLKIRKEQGIIETGELRKLEN